MKVGISDKFDAAHFLPGYLGKCVNLHGHTWTVDVEIEGKVNKLTGMLIDFTKLKYLLKTVLEKLDHDLLNRIVDMPTCENIATYIAGEMSKKIEIDMRTIVTVREGDGGWAQVESQLTS